MPAPHLIDMAAALFLDLENTLLVKKHVKPERQLSVFWRQLGHEPVSTLVLWKKFMSKSLMKDFTDSTDPFYGLYVASAFERGMEPYELLELFQRYSGLDMGTRGDQEQYVERQLRHFEQRWSWLPGGRELLTDLAGVLPLAIITNLDWFAYQSVKTALAPQNLVLPGMFLASPATGSKKPELYMYQTAWELAGSPDPYRVLYACDGGSTEYVGAKEMGFRLAMSFVPGGHAATHLDEAGARSNLDYGYVWPQELRYEPSLAPYFK